MNRLCVSHFIICSPTKMVPVEVESSRGINYDIYLNSFHQCLLRRFERINDRIGRHEVSILFNQIYNWPSRLGLQNTLTASLQEGMIPETSVLYMTVNNLMVRFQQCGKFGEYGVPVYGHRSYVHSGPEWWHLIGSNLWVK